MPEGARDDQQTLYRTFTAEEYSGRMSRRSQDGFNICSAISHIYSASLFWLLAASRLAAFLCGWQDWGRGPNPAIHTKRLAKHRRCWGVREYL